jgi:hypothetical protein
VLDTASEIVLALLRYSDVFDPAAGSLIIVSDNGLDPHADPFRNGFIGRIEERAELVRRLRRLDQRLTKLLLFWYVWQWPIKRITRNLRVSRQHCYRLRNKAIDDLVAMAEQVRQPPAPEAAKSAKSAQLAQSP